VDSSSSGTAGGIGDPDDDHKNPVGDAVVDGARKLLGKLGSAGEKAAEHLPKKQQEE
jgi:hypothetical protein